MNKEELIKMHMKSAKMNYLDDIFLGTQESQGLRNAVSAIKFVLFNDKSVVPIGMEIKDKYEFISSRYNGRAKAKLFQYLDMLHILCKYALCSFGIRNEPFNLDDDFYLKVRNSKDIEDDIDEEKAVELLSYALVDDIYGGYILVASNEGIRTMVINHLISERYIKNLRDELDSFDEIITNKEMDGNLRVMYLDCFQKLDEVMYEIKNKDINYIK